MTAQRQGPVAEKLRSKEKARRELCQSRDEAEAVSKAEVDSLRSSVDTVSSSTQQITRWIDTHNTHTHALTLCFVAMRKRVGRRPSGSSMIV